MKYIELRVHSFRASTVANQKAVVLSEVLHENDGTSKSPRFLAIWLADATFDAMGIAGIVIEKTGLPGPQTHDLIKKILGTVGCHLKGVLISDWRNGVFFAQAMIEMNDKSYTIDCMPSDAIAMAVRADAPIATTEEVMAKISFPENEINAQPYFVPIKYIGKKDPKGGRH